MAVYCGQVQYRVTSRCLYFWEGRKSSPFVALRVSVTDANIWRLLTDNCGNSVTAREVPGGLETCLPDRAERESQARTSCVKHIYMAFRETEVVTSLNE
jgi:hypothetical protein